MKFSLKKEYKKLFENISMQSLPREDLIDLIRKDLPATSMSNIGDARKEKSKFSNLASNLISFLEDSNNIELILDESSSFSVSLTNRQIFEVYFILLKEQVVENTNTDFQRILESTQELNFNDIVSSLFDISSDRGGGEDLLRNVIFAENAQKFILNIFIFLYRKLIAKDNLSPKSDAESIKNIENNIESYLKKIVEIFKDKIIKKQSGLSTTFGTTFEVIALNRIQETLNLDKVVDREYGINKSLLASKDFQIASKKATILILLIMQNKFNSSNEFYTKLTGGRQDVTEDFWINCFASVFEEVDVTQLRNLDDIVNKYAGLLGHNRSEVSCLDYEEDELLLKGSRLDKDNKISIPSKNAYFDFIIRTKQENKVSNKKINFGLFDLKCTNAKVRSSSQPINRGSTGNNKNNRAIQNIRNTILSFDNMTTNPERSVLHFISLVQITYELVVRNNNISIEIKSVSDIYNTPTQVINNNIDNDHLNIKNIENDTSRHINPTPESLAREIITSEIYKSEYSDIKFSKHVSQFERIFDLLGVLRECGYDGSFKDNINYSNYIDMLKNSFNHAEEFYKIKEHTSTIKEVIKKEHHDDYEHDTEFDTLIDKVSNDTSFNLEKIVLDCISFLTFNKNNYIKAIYKSAPGPTQKQNFKRNISLYILSVYEDSKIENYNKYKNSSNVIDTLLTNKDDRPYDFQFSKLNKTVKIDSLRKIAQPILDKVLEIKRQVQNDINNLIMSDEIASSTRFAFSKEDLPFIERKLLLKNKLLKEVYSHLFKKKIIKEGGLAGHMMHPYEALDMTPKQIIDRIEEYGTSQSIIEKVDGQNLFFTVEQDGTLMFARNKQDMTYNDLVAKFTGHPAEIPFLQGGRAIKNGVDNWLSTAGDAAGIEIQEIFHPDGETKSFINFEIMHPEKPNQIVYDKKYIVFHSIVDFVNGRETTYSTNKGQRLEKLIRLMSEGVSSAGFTLASNRTVNLNQLETNQIDNYISRVIQVARQLGISENEFLGDGIEKQIKKEIEKEGVVISDEAAKLLFDFVLYGESKSGSSIKSRDFTSLMSKEDVTKLRSIGLTSASKALKKVQHIISPFKEIFVDLGIDLLSGVKSAYMSDETNQMNIDLLKDKLQTAVNDLVNYMKENSDEFWEPEVHRLMPHLNKILDKDINLIVSTAVEGGVYDHQGDLLKVTGGFAPLNQILGAAYRDKKGIFPTFKEKFVQQESNRISLRTVFNSIF